MPELRSLAAASFSSQDSEPLTGVAGSQCEHNASRLASEGVTRSSHGSRRTHCALTTCGAMVVMVMLMVGVGGYLQGQSLCGQQAQPGFRQIAEFANGWFFGLDTITCALALRTDGYNYNCDPTLPLCSEATCASICEKEACGTGCPICQGTGAGIPGNPCNGCGSDVSCQAYTQISAVFVADDGGGAYTFGREGDKAWDDDPSTFYDAWNVSNGYTAADMSAQYRIHKIAYIAREGWRSRMVGGQFEGANDLNGPWAILTTITSQPLSNPSFNHEAINNTGFFQYVRYHSPVNGHCNVADIYIFGEQAVCLPDAFPFCPSLSCNSDSASHCQTTCRYNGCTAQAPCFSPYIVTHHSQRIFTEWVPIWQATQILLAFLFRPSALIGAAGGATYSFEEINDMLQAPKWLGGKKFAFWSVRTHTIIAFAQGVLWLLDLCYFCYFKPPHPWSFIQASIPRVYIFKFALMGPILSLLARGAAIAWSFRAQYAERITFALDVKIYMIFLLVFAPMLVYVPSIFAIALVAEILIAPTWLIPMFYNIIFNFCYAILLRSRRWRRHLPSRCCSCAAAEQAAPPLIASEASCRRGHALELYFRPRKNCDQCGIRGTQYRCNSGCEYDLCAACHSGGLPSPTSRILWSPRVKALQPVWRNYSKHRWYLHVRDCLSLCAAVYLIGVAEGYTHSPGTACNYENLSLVKMSLGSGSDAVANFFVVWILSSAFCGMVLWLKMRRFWTNSNQGARLPCLRCRCGCQRCCANTGCGHAFANFTWLPFADANFMWAIQFMGRVRLVDSFRVGIVRLQDENGWCALHGAAKAGAYEAVQRVLDFGVEVDMETSPPDCLTALLLAARHGHVSTAQLLIDARANIEAQDGVLGWTPLLWATRANSTATVRILLQAGADVEFKAFDGRTALAWAVFNGLWDIEQLLRDAGALAYPMPTYQIEADFPQTKNIGVIGETSVGKSSFINRVLGVSASVEIQMTGIQLGMLESRLRESNGIISAQGDWASMGQRAVKDGMWLSRVNGVEVPGAITEVIRMLSPRGGTLRFIDPSAAVVGATQTTMSPTRYPFPAEPQVRLWDLPGSGTPEFPEATYVSNMGVKYYDAIVLIGVGPWKESMMRLVRDMLMNSIKFFLVVNKVDVAVQANLDDYGTPVEKTLSDLRSEMQPQGLISEGISAPDKFEVYLVSCKLAQLVECVHCREPLVCPKCALTSIAATPSFDLERLKEDLRKYMCEEPNMSSMW